MTAASSRCLAFFDPENAYRLYDVTFDPRVFIRFIEYQSCLEHLINHATVSEQDFHLFFSSLNEHLLKESPTALTHVIKYIFCRDEAAKQQIQTLYDRRFDRKIILEEDLEVEISHIQFKLLYSMMKKMPDESVQRDECGKTIIATLELMRHNVARNMSIPSGVAPVEIHIETENA